MISAVSVPAETADPTSERAHDASDTATGPGAATDLDFLADWPEEFTGYDPVLDPAPSGTTHEYTFEMTEDPIEVAPAAEQGPGASTGDPTAPPWSARFANPSK